MHTPKHSNKQLLLCFFITNWESISITNLNDTLLSTEVTVLDPLALRVPVMDFLGAGEEEDPAVDDVE